MTHGNEKDAGLRAALERVEALVGEWERVPNGFGQQGPTFRQAATLIRSALDTHATESAEEQPR